MTDANLYTATGYAITHTTGVAASMGTGRGVILMANGVGAAGSTKNNGYQIYANPASNIKSNG